MIGDRLIGMFNIKCFCFVFKGLVVVLSCILDELDGWVNVFIDIFNKVKKVGKVVVWYIYFNYFNEILWISKDVSQKLFEEGVMV